MSDTPTAPSDDDQPGWTYIDEDGEEVFVPNDDCEQDEGGE